MDLTIGGVELSMRSNSCQSQARHSRPYLRHFESIPAMHPPRARLVCRYPSSFSLRSDPSRAIPSSIRQQLALEKLSRSVLWRAPPIQKAAPGTYATCRSIAAGSNCVVSNGSGTSTYRNRPPSGNTQVEPFGKRRAIAAAIISLRSRYTFTSCETWPPNLPWALQYAATSLCVRPGV